MKYLSINLTLALSVLLFGFTASSAQLADEIRPFDFNNDFYRANGIIAELLQDRRNGVDGKSVFDTPTDLARFNNVRIIETLPAYAPDGNTLYWNRHAVAPKESLMGDEGGYKTAQIASLYPIYRFPSTSVSRSDRQTSMIGIDDRYFEINPLGIGQVVNVLFRERMTPGGRKMLEMLAERNGRSVDGTPIIRTLPELKGLAENGLVTLEFDENAPYMIAKVIRHPEIGGITPDAFLDYVKQANGLPLVAETHIVKKFNCLQDERNCP